MTPLPPAASPPAERTDACAASPRLVGVARLDAIPPGHAMEVVAAGVAIAVFNIDGHLHAIEDHCVGCGFALAQGAVALTTVACPGCGWRYDLVTGALIALPAIRIDTFAVHIDARRGVLELALPVAVKG